MSEGARVVHALTGDGADVSVRPQMVVDDNAECVETCSEQSATSTAVGVAADRSC